MHTDRKTMNRRSLTGLLRAFVRSPLEAASWRATGSIVLGLFIAILSVSLLSACFSTGGSLLIWLVGIPIIALGIECARLFAQVERWRLAAVDGRPLVAHAYRAYDGPPRRPYGAWVRSWADVQFLDVNRWRDVVYVLVLFPLAVLEFSVVIGLWVSAVALIVSPLIVRAIQSTGLDLIPAELPAAWTAGLVVAVVVGLVLIPVASSVSRGLVIMHRAVVQALLCVDPTEALRQDVERLRGSRSAALELEAAELRRIERDLHDGAQQRLVALTIDLGLAEERIDADPAAAKTLVKSARDQARQALAELRDLVRGTAPAILVDRGLEAALGSLAGGSPIPTALDSSLAPGARLPAAVERAAYFVVAESLANAAKHSAATRCEVSLALAPGRLLVEVRDEGVGGATIEPGGGLAGLRDRVEALDGTLTVSSPPTGGTVIQVALPVVAA